MKKFFVLLFLMLASRGRANVVYSENFSAYTNNSNITANPPNYTVLGNNMFLTAHGLGGQCANANGMGAATVAFYNGASFTYTDVSLTCSDTCGFGGNTVIMADTDAAMQIGGPFPLHGYFAYFDGVHTWYMYKVNGLGVYVQLGTTATYSPNVNSFNMRLLCTGATVSFYVDGNLLVGPISDTTFTSGYIGFGSGYCQNNFTGIVVDDGSNASPTNSPTASPTFSPSPTASPTPCGDTYYENFSSYAPNSSLFANPPAFLGVTNSSSAWYVAAGLGQQAAQSGNPGGAWTSVRALASYSGYFDWKGRVDAQTGRVYLFFQNQNTFFSDSEPTTGYELSLVYNSLITLNRVAAGPETLIAYSSVTPGNWSNFTVEYRNNAGVIDVFIDGNPALHVVDLTWTSGYWGLSSLFQSGYVSNMEINGGSCLPTNTMTFTPAPTPTAASTAVLCGTPWPRQLTQILTPILVANKTFEQGGVGEVSVLKTNLSHPYQMIYGANAFTLGGLPFTSGHAVASNPLGPWTKDSGDHPILGNGYGGEAGQAGRPSMVIIGGQIWVYYKDSYGNECRAAFDGVTCTKSAQVVISFNALNVYNVASFDSMGFCKNAVTGNWEALVDADYKSGVQFRLWRFTSTDNGATFQPVTVIYLNGAAPGADYGSPRAFWYDSPTATYHFMYLYNVPSDIYEAVSTDLYNWRAYGSPSLLNCPAGVTCSGSCQGTPVASGVSNLYGMAASQQIADPALLDDGSTVYIYDDATDNCNKAAALGVNVYPGTLDQWGGCGVVPTATPTPGPSTYPFKRTLTLRTR